MPLTRVSVNQDKIEINPERIESAANRILSVLGYTDAELSVLIVDDEEMADINREFRNEDSPTDVLSFPMWEGEYGEIHAEMIGDVVISAPTAERMSKFHRTSLSSVIDLLLVHGILHLVGLDHERNEEEAARMEERTMEILGALGHSATDYDWYMR